MTDTVVLSHLGPMEDIAAAVPGVTIIPIGSDGPIEPALRGDVLLTLMTGASNLREVVGHGVWWVHAVGTGVDAFPLDIIGDRLLTCSRGVNAVNVAEWAFAQMITAEKQLPAQWRNEPPPQWGRVELGTLAGRTLGIVGLGSIGTALARRALAFDMRVRALRRRDLPSSIEGVEIVTSVEALVADADHVVLAAPATAATRGVAGDAFFAAMRPGAHLVNVARADLVDETALRAALDSGHLALASLDVCSPEPLPAGHWFYEHPRVRFSPHVSWSGPGLWQATIGLFVDNLTRWRSGEPLVGVVDIEEGY